MRHESVNQYGSVYGYLEVDTLSLQQLRVEKASLELLLAGQKLRPLTHSANRSYLPISSLRHPWKWSDAPCVGQQYVSPRQLRLVEALRLLSLRQLSAKIP